MPSYSRRVKVPGKSSQELYEIISQDIESFLGKGIGKVHIDRDASRREFKIKGSMFSATLVCAESEMELNAHLSLLAAPFKSKLDEGITRWLSKKFQNIT